MFTDAYAQSTIICLDQWSCQSYFKCPFWLQILEKVKLAYDIPIVTDVHETIQVISV